MTEQIKEALDLDYKAESEPSTEIPVDDMPAFDDIPDMEEAAAEAEKFNVIEDDRKTKTAIRMAFIGVGQAGGNITEQFYKQGYRRVLAINTTGQDMKSLTIPSSNQFVMEGYGGAGKDPNKGAEAAKKYYEDIVNKLHACFGKNVEQIIVSASGGGGTGSGAIGIVVDAAKAFMQQIGKDIKVGVILAMADKVEKGAAQLNSQSALNKLLEKSKESLISPFIVVDNGQIAKFFPNESIANFYPKSNQIVCGILDRLNTITAYASPIGYNVDLADFKSVLSGGVTTFGQCKIKEGTSLADGIVKNVKNSLLSQEFDASTASHAACLIIGGEKEINSITKDSVDKALESLSRVFTDKEVKVHLGIYKQPTPGISVFTVVSGLKKA